MSIAGVLFITRGPNKQFKYSFQFEMVRKSTEKFNHKIGQKNDHTIHKKILDLRLKNIKIQHLASGLLANL